MTRVVVVGGGFAGLNASLAASRVAEGRLSVTLISRDPWLTIRPRLYERQPETLRADLIKPLNAAGAQFVRGEVSRVSRDGVALDTCESVPFDRLIVATGSVMPRPPVSGAETAFSIDDMRSAIEFDQHLAVISKMHSPRSYVTAWRRTQALLPGMPPACFCSTATAMLVRN
jgi:NADH:ubiquinone reductase (H+-translocating)